MMAPNLIAAQTLEERATELANSARDRFLATRDQTDPVPDELRDEWSHHFRQRVMELSAALAAGEAALFTNRVTWSRRALEARLSNNIPIRATLQSLRETLLEHCPAEIMKDALSCIDQALREYRTALPESQVSQLDPQQPLQRLALLYLHSVMEGNINQGMAVVLDAIEKGLPHADAITKVLLPAQGEVGHLWHIDHITIAEEHLVTTTTQRLMAVIMDRAPKMPARGRTAVAASVGGNVHDIGIRAIAYLLEMSGWRSIFLGADVPRQDLPAAIHFFDADVAMLSVALSAQFGKLRESIDTIRQTCDNDIRILVGGSAFADAPEAWKPLGADGYARDAVSAVMMAGDMVTGQRHH